MKELFASVFEIDGMLATVNLLPGERVYDEKLVESGGVELRLWNPNRSKLSAAILNGLETLPIKPGVTVLYLGAASGTTASHVSDIVGEDGLVLSVEHSKKPMENLFNLSLRRENMIPLFYDANHPYRYAALMEKVDVVYQDVAQKNQAEILLKNAELYLKDGGHILLAIKAKSIDSTRKTEEVIAGEIAR
ncbi:MAG: fibrillarin-like rRNA/tRNA 2'-O-methyltransferase, partial [Candidatus Hydrothermarchaeales archaeon]